MFEPKKYPCLVKLLDGEDFQFEVTKQVHGMTILDKVCDHLGLDEKDYFGLKYVNAKDKKVSWLDLGKSLRKQLGQGKLSFTFAVKFFPPTPNAIQHEITRYHFVLQLRQDLLTGRLTCSTPIHALLASYLVQAEVGDYDDLREKDKYIRGFEFMPDQRDEFLDKVMEFHKKHSGLTPADSEFQYLENARKLPLYGMDLHESQDADNSEILVGVSAQGVHIVKQGRQINKFAWPCVMEIGFQGKKFLLDIRAVSETEFEDMVLVMKFKTRTELKRMYRAAVDHHSFFRRAKPQPPRSGGFFRLGSKFRYSGRRTFSQTKNAVYGHFPAAFRRIDSQHFQERVMKDETKSYLNDMAKKIGEHSEDICKDEKKDDWYAHDSPTIGQPNHYVIAEEKTALITTDGKHEVKGKVEGCNGC